MKIPAKVSIEDNKVTLTIETRGLWGELHVHARRTKGGAFIHDFGTVQRDQRIGLDIQMDERSKPRTKEELEAKIAELGDELNWFKHILSEIPQ